MDKLISAVKTGGLLAREGVDGKIIEKVLDQPEEQAWIQVTERMPEEEGRYLVTRGSGEDTYTTFLNWNKSEGWYVDCLRPVDVIAWMPLPEPYQEGGE